MVNKSYLLPSMDNSNNSKSENNPPKNNDVQSDYLQQVMKPTYLLMGSCIPLLLGAYAGYKSELKRAASSSTSSASMDAYSPGFTSSGGGLLTRVIGDEIMDAKLSNTSSKVKSATKAVEQSHVPHVDVGRVAFKALGVGSLLSIGGFGLLTLAVFKLTGSQSLDDLINKCKRWTPKKRKEFEQTFGIKPKSMEHEDVKATKGMTEDEEWEFIKKKYIPELVEKRNQK